MTAGKPSKKNFSNKKYGGKKYHEKTNPIYSTHYVSHGKHIRALCRNNRRRG